jgi:HAE1 family hydrophobic/amphiphilic exporter-1
LLSFPKQVAAKISGKDGVEQNGFERRADETEAAKHTIKDFYTPLTSGTLTTIAVFAPLFLVSGITGEFIASIPFTIIFVLLASLFVALAFIPLIAINTLSSKPDFLAHKRDIIIKKITNWYSEYLTSFLKDRASGILLSRMLLSVFIGALLLPVFGFVQVIFFASSDEGYVFIEIETQKGSELALTDIELRKVEEILYTIPEIESFVSTVGQTSEFSNSFGGAQSGTSFANIFITLRSDRTQKSSVIESMLRDKVSDIHSSLITVGSISNGPPSGAPILVTFSGESLETLDTMANRAREILQGIDGVVDISASTKDNGTAVVIDFDKAKALQLGVSAQTAALTTRGALFGSTPTTIKNLGDDIDVVTKLLLSENARSPHTTNKTSVDAILNIPIQSFIPQRESNKNQLGVFSTVSLEENRAVIRHENTLRISQVSANITEGFNARDLMQEFKKHTETELDIPNNVTMKLGGETEDIDQSFKDMFVALILGIASMFAILVIQFNSFRLSGYVLVTVPLSLIGVFAGLLVMSKPLSFPSILGFIALAGIVVNNAIILIDTMNQHVKSDTRSEVLEEVVTATTTRLRPIILTMITTVVGIFPLVFAADIWAPLAYSIMFGLTFATILTLLLVPSLYYRNKIKSLPEEIENKGIIENY